MVQKYVLVVEPVTSESRKIIKKISLSISNFTAAIVDKAIYIHLYLYIYIRSINRKICTHNMHVVTYG